MAFLILALGYVLSQFYRSFLATLTPALREDLAIGDAGLSFASGAWFASFAAMQFLVGYCLDTYGPKRTTSIMLGLFGGAGTALFAFAQTSAQLTGAMMLIGIGFSPVLMAAFYLFARNFNARNFATLASLFIAFGSLGVILSSDPLAWAAQEWGWRNTSLIFCGLTIATALGLAIAMKDPEPIPRSPEQKTGFLELLKIKALWPILPCILVGYAVPASIRGLWAGPFLQDVHGMDVIEIGRATLYMSVALTLGVIFYGPLDRVFDSRKKVILAGNAIMIFLMLGLSASAFLSSDALVPVALMSAAMIFAATYPVQMAHGRSFLPANMIGRGVTLMNFFSMGGVGLLQFVSGGLVESARQPGDPAAPYALLFFCYALIIAVPMAIYALFARDAKPSAASPSG